jgi:hypothetical protein
MIIIIILVVIVIIIIIIIVIILYFFVIYVGNFGIDSFLEEKNSPPARMVYVLLNNFNIT